MLYMRIVCVCKERCVHVITVGNDLYKESRFTWRESMLHKESVCVYKVSVYAHVHKVSDPIKRRKYTETECEHGEI